MNKILFSKYSNERARRFALRTDIVEENGVRYVKKSAMYPEGKAHISNILRWYQELEQRYEDSAIRMNRCEQSGDSVILEYLEGDTLEHLLDGYLLKGQPEKVLETLFAYLEEIKKGFTKEAFEMTPEFEEVFGKVNLPENLLCGDVVNVDMVLNNVILQDGWTLIDYEWTFDFPIPYHFVVYRILSYYLKGSAHWDALQAMNLFEKAGITDDEIPVYQSMEHRFQAIYVVSEGTEGKKHVPIRDLFDAISPGNVDLTGLKLKEQSARAARMVQCYQAPDMNFTEEHSEKRDVWEDGRFEGSFSLEENCQYVRLDPCSKDCVLKNLCIVWGEKVPSMQSNGVAGKDGNLFFAMEDPQIILQRPKGAGNELKISFEVEYLEIRDLFRAITPDSMNLSELLFKERTRRAARMVQCYQASDLNFTEERSQKCDGVESGVFEGAFSIASDCQYVRLDPCAQECIIKRLKMNWGKSIASVQTNGITRKDGNLFFATEDPQIIVKRPAGASDVLTVSFETEYLQKEEAFALLQEEFAYQNQMLEETRQKLAQKEALIHEMENTKVWKAYRKLKRN